MSNNQKSPMEWLREGYGNNVKQEDVKPDNQEKIIELNEGKIDFDNPFYLLRKAYEIKTK